MSDHSAAPRITVLRALGLGDLLTAVPALRALRRAYPSHLIHLAAPATLGPLAALSGAVDETVDCQPLQELPHRLRGPSIAVNLHGRGPQSHALLRQIRPRRTFAFRDGPWAPGPPWRVDEHEVIRWCRLLTAYGLAADPHDLRLEPPRVPSAHPASGAVIVHPGAGSPARRWPPERFAAVARTLAARGRCVLITGTADERPLARSVASAAGLSDDHVIAGGTDLLELAAVVAHADGLVCGDTGVAHLATAFGTPSVVLFGPLPPSRWGPLIDTHVPIRRHATLWAGSTGDPHGDRPDPGLLRIDPEDVLHALAGVVRSGARRETAPGRA